MSQRGPFEEVWVNLPDGQAMCALINGEVGWLMYMRKDGDAGFSSLNPRFSGADSKLEFQLENGQRDFYPSSWTLPISTTVRAALEHFRSTGRPPQFVSWHNDSGDGEAIEGAA